MSLLIGGEFFPVFYGVASYLKHQRQIAVLTLNKEQGHLIRSMHLRFSTDSCLGAQHSSTCYQHAACGEKREQAFHDRFSGHSRRPLPLDTSLPYLSVPFKKAVARMPLSGGREGVEGKWRKFAKVWLGSDCIMPDGDKEEVCEACELAEYKALKGFHCGWGQRH